MNEADILVIMHPNTREVKSVIIVDPFDGKIEQYKVDSVEEAKEVLRQNLPFCDQGHSPILHMGVAYITEWQNKDILAILYPNKNELKSIIIIDFRNNKVEMYKVDSEAKQLLGQHLENLVEWESLPETDAVITKPADIDALR